jgi:hypothetical protein
MRNIDPHAQATWSGYGCLRCQVLHFEGSKLYKPHMSYQNKGGIRTYSAAERSQHLVATDQSVEELPEEDVRNALAMLVSVPVDGQGRHVLGADKYAVVDRRLRAAVQKLARMRRQEPLTNRGGRT